MERLAGARELLDGPLEPATLAGNLRDLARVNRFLGGAELSWRALTRAVDAPNWPATGLTLLDVGTGAADIPRHLLRRAAAEGRALSVTATDIRSEVLDFAQRTAAGVVGLTVARAGAERLDFADGAFDVVHASLVLHHLEPPAATALLREMSRVSARAVIVNELARARRWWLAAWLASRAVTRNRYTRHDAPLSVRRAYRPAELAVLAAQAGLRPAALLRAGLGYRYAFVLVGR